MLPSINSPLAKQCVSIRHECYFSRSRAIDLSFSFLVFVLETDRLIPDGVGVFVSSRSCEQIVWARCIASSLSLCLLEM